MIKPTGETQRAAMEVGNKRSNMEQKMVDAGVGPRHSNHCAFPQEGANGGKRQAATL